MVHAQASAPICWEDADCPLCGRVRPIILMESFVHEFDRTFQLIRCHECGMGYTHPRPALADLPLLYPPHYEAYQPSRPGDRRHWLKRQRWRLEQWCHRNAMSKKTTWKKCLGQWLLPILSPRPDTMMALPLEGEGRLLDLGCGIGEYAQKMTERGWRVDGLDLSAHAAAEAERLFGLKVWVGSLPHPRVAPQSYDVITMGQVLEHVPHPHQIVAAVVEALKPGGRLVVSVPNLDGWGRSRFGPYWWPLQMPRHLLHFTPSTLNALMRMHGLEVESLRMMKPTHWLSRSWRLGAAEGWKRQTPPLWSMAGRWRWGQSIWTKWLAWSGQSDGLLMVARKPKVLKLGLSHWPVQDLQTREHAVAKSMPSRFRDRLVLPSE